MATPGPHSGGSPLRGGVGYIDGRIKRPRGSKGSKGRPSKEYLKELRASSRRHIYSVLNDVFSPEFMPYRALSARMASILLILHDAVNGHTQRELALILGKRTADDLEKYVRGPVGVLVSRAMASVSPLCYDLRRPGPHPRIHITGLGRIYIKKLLSMISRNFFKEVSRTDDEAIFELDLPEGAASGKVSIAIGRDNSAKVTIPADCKIDPRGLWALVPMFMPGADLDAFTVPRFSDSGEPAVSEDQMPSSLPVSEAMATWSDPPANPAVLDREYIYAVVLSPPVKNGAHDPDRSWTIGVAIPGLDGKLVVRTLADDDDVSTRYVMAIKPIAKSSKIDLSHDVYLALLNRVRSEKAKAEGPVAEAMAEAKVKAETKTRRIPKMKR